MVRAKPEPLEGKGYGPPERRRNPIGKVFRRAPRVLGALAANPLIAGRITSALARGALRDACRMTRTMAQRPGLRVAKIVSRRYRYLWICVPKAASRSLINALLDADPDAEIFRRMTLREVHAIRPESKRYYSFAFVRHPFDRAFSWYWEVFFSHSIYAATYDLYSKQKDRSVTDPATGRRTSVPFPPSEQADPRWKEHKRRSFLRSYYGIAETSSFDDFCQWLNTPFGSDTFADDHFLSQHVQLDLGDGRRPDFIGRVENLDADLNQVTAHLRMPAPVLLRSNTSVGWLATREAIQAARKAQEPYFTERNREFLRKRYAGDFALGGYSPAGTDTMRSEKK